MSSSKDRQNAVRKLKSLLFTSKSDVSSFRQKIEDTFSNIFLPNGVECSEKDYGKIKCDLLVPEIYSSNRIMIYIHGGSFVGGSRASFRPFAASLANAISGKVVVPEFRLAPAFPFPNGLEDVQNVIQAVYTEQSIALSMNSEDISQDEPELIIAADTSGASIAMAFAFRMNERLRKAVKKIVLFSPWLNFSEDDDIFTGKKIQDEVFTAESVRLCAENYTFQENWKNPQVSPFNAPRELILNLPEIYIQCGRKEIFYDDNVMFAAMLKNAGIICDLDVWPDMMPMFQLADEYLSESHLAIEKIGKLFTTQKRDDEM